MPEKSIEFLPESSRLEFKERIPSSDKIAALLCAFANTSGGDLIVGVEDRTGRVVGVPESEVLAMEEKLASIASTNVSPILFPLIKTVRKNEKVLVQVHVDMGFQKPYRVITGAERGKIFVRIGSTTRQADRAAEDAMGLRSHGLSWDCLPCHECLIAELDKTIIKEFLDARWQRRKIDPPIKIDAAWLTKMRFGIPVGEKRYATNGAVLLFHKNPQEVFPNAGIEMARFSGTTGRDFLDKQTIAGPLWKLYDDILAFMRRNVPTSALRTGLARREVVAYPEIAFREFMVNALCHRAYEQNTGSVRCAIFDDTIQITNPGTLPDGLELEDIGTGISVIRNPLIARVFNELGLIEGWGTGIQVAQQELARNHLPSARIEQRGFFIRLTSQWRWSSNLSLKELAIVRETAEKGAISSKQIGSAFAITERAARKALVRLVKKGLLEKSGSTKGTEYRLK